MTDKELIDWLAERNYVEATDSGNEDPKRFLFHRYLDGNFRAALMLHIEKHRK